MLLLRGVTKVLGARLEAEATKCLPDLGRRATGPENKMLCNGATNA